MSLEYYANTAVSQSFLKNMYKGLGQIHKYQLMGEKNYNLSLCDSIVTGKAVDCLITTPYDFETEFVVNDLDNPPDSIIKLFTYLIKEYKITPITIKRKAVTAEEVMGEDYLRWVEYLYFDDYKKEIIEYLENIKYEGFGKSRGTYEKVKDKIDPWAGYFCFLVNSNNKTILDKDRKMLVYHLQDILVSHEFTEDIINFPARVFQKKFFTTYEDIEVKGMTDMILFNETDSVILLKNGLKMAPHSFTVVDIKTGYFRPENVTDYMHKWRIDLQLAFYTMLAKLEYPSLKANNPVIVYAQTSMNTSYPSVKQLTDEELYVGRHGKTSGDKPVYGFEKCISIYKHYTKHGWDIDWQLSQNKGLIK